MGQAKQRGTRDERVAQAREIKRLKHEATILARNARIDQEAMRFANIKSLGDRNHIGMSPQMAAVMPTALMAEQDQLDANDPIGPIGGFESNCGQSEPVPDPAPAQRTLVMRERLEAAVAAAGMKLIVKD